MPYFPLAWVVWTVLAAATQTARNATQRGLATTLGTVGATHARFLFGFPFALIILAGVVAYTGIAPPLPRGFFWPWVAMGAFAQVLATALMLAAMRERSFVVTTAYTKTEPVQVALFGVVFLGELLSLWSAVAILLATAGVMVMSWPRAGTPSGSTRSIVFGVASGGLFALAAIGFRGGVTSFPYGTDNLIAASVTLVAALFLQAAGLSLYLAIRERAVLIALLRSWRPSLLAGVLGALASEFWFLGFSLASAASVRTLGLV
ncbi:MAG: DMT family transporter, partial [Bauldia sp.]|nr:DMT family transporter [Bauldia sp.]